MTDRYRWLRRKTKPTRIDGAFSPSEGTGTGHEATFEVSLDSLFRAARAEACPVDHEAAWQRIEASLSAPARVRRSVASPFARLSLVVAAACLVLFLGWQGMGRSRPPQPEAATIRLTPAIWHEEVIAADPLDGATDALIDAVQEATL
jgi:hypothetical protein